MGTAPGKPNDREFIRQLGEHIRADEPFRQAFECSPSAMVMVGHEGKIGLVNSQAEKLFGYTREELMGQTIEMLVPESSRKSHAILRGAYMAHPQARPIGVVRDLLARRKDGTLFPVEIGLNPIESEGGNWVLSSIVDITERKRAEEATLLESEERFRNMADTAPVMIWASGPDKLCTFFNKVWLDFTGRTMEQELGEGWAKGVHPDDLDRCIGTYSASFDARRRFRMEYRLRRADGEYGWLLDDGVPRFTPGGNFAGYIGSCIDITEVKRTLEAALASQKLESVGQLASGIAHDFNNLLGGILASAELGLGGCAEGTSPEEELLRIRTAAIRGGEIVRQLLTYSGEEDLAFEPIDLSLLVDEMLQLLKISISKQAILKTELGQGLPAVRANPAQIRQVVLNLVTNASEAIGEQEGIIRVTTSRVSVGLDESIKGAGNLPAGDYVKLEVSDTGSGMMPQVQAKIFDPFFTTKFTGRGLGLATVQGIVRGHLGTIKVVSSLGQGTRFEVLLPCTNLPARDVRDIAAPVSASDVGSVTGTVLVVEDEDTLRLPVSKMLRMKGFSVIEAADGSAAIDLIRAHVDIDVVLLDMTIPGASSREVIAEAGRVRPDVKIVLTSAYSREMTPAPDAPQIHGFIRKPFPLGDLVQLLSDTLS